jgi:hypothetical protein
MQIKKSERHTEGDTHENLSEMITEKINHFPQVEGFSVFRRSPGSGVGNGVTHQKFKIKTGRSAAVFGSRAK